MEIVDQQVGDWRGKIGRWHERWIPRLRRDVPLMNLPVLAAAE